MSLAVLDTDVASALLRRRVPDDLVGQLSGHVMAVTFVTVGELTKWTLVRRWGPRSLAMMRTFLAGLVVLPYDRQVAARWGELQAGLRAAPRLSPACQRQLDRGLLPRPRGATRRVRRKDFADFAEHEGLELVR